MDHGSVTQHMDEGPLVDRVVAGLTRTIRVDLSPGARLPSEAHLAVTYAVSRLTVREAVKVLAGRGLLEVARGRRAVVRKPDGAAFGDLLAMPPSTTRNPSSISWRCGRRWRCSRPPWRPSAPAGRDLPPSRARCPACGRPWADIEAGPDRSAAEQVFNRADVGFHEALALSGGNRMLALFPRGDVGSPGGFVPHVDARAGDPRPDPCGDALRPPGDPRRRERGRQPRGCSGDAGPPQGRGA